MSTSELKTIAIREIAVSKTNPRQSFDETAMTELTDSIRENGLLQPILVRPGKTKKHPYELVCGERRLRASVSVMATFKDRDTIPAIVRELTDDEAFELQIIENLERKDVHPLDEADAFKKMLDSGKYTVEDISAKMAKSERFITHRLKLVDLATELRQDFIDGHFGIGHAVLLARVPFRQQKERYMWARSGYNADPKQPEYGTVKAMGKYLTGQGQAMKGAKFPKDKDEYVKGACACDVCPKRSASNPVLFDDMQDDTCMDLQCFASKTLQYIETKLASIISSGKEVAIISGRSEIQWPSDTVKALCKQYDIKVLKNHIDYSDWERSSYTKMSSFSILDGSQKKVWVKPMVANSVKATGDGEDAAIAQIENIETRAKRALELDNEKVEAAIRVRLGNVNGDSKAHLYSREAITSNLERAVIIYAMCETGHGAFRDWIEKELGIESYDYRGLEIWNGLIEVADAAFFNEALRKFAHYKLTDHQVEDRIKSGRSEALYQYANFRFPDMVTEVQKEQDEVAAKRIQRTEERIAKLKTDLGKDAIKGLSALLDKK